MTAASPSGRLCERVRRHCAQTAATARWVHIDATAVTPFGGVAGLDHTLHFLEGDTEEVARYVLVLDAVNFGSAWFPSLELPPQESGTVAITRALTEHARRRGGTWSTEELRRMRPEQVASTLGQPAGHELMALYAHALRQLGDWLGRRSALEVIAQSGRSAERFAGMLASGMPFFDDAGFYKRAQITAADLVHAGVADFDDVDELTVFADDLLPHVLRLDGILVYRPELTERVDAGRPLPSGSAMEVEIRACAVHACEGLAARLRVPPRILDNWLWNRGEAPPYNQRPAHRTYTVFY